MPQRIVTLGEIMLRLKPPGHERFFQSPVLEATFGGAESNVAVSLAGYGLDAAFVTVLPANAIGDAVVAELRRFGVDTSLVRRGGERLGIYFLEGGANQRPSKVVYDRAHSAIATATSADFDWDRIFDRADWFHITGITPALSAAAAGLSIDAAREARARGVTVSCDYNYRSNLWKYGRNAPEVMRELLAHVDVGIAGAEDCRLALGLEIEPTPGSSSVDQQHYARLAGAVLDAFPNLSRQVITLRDSRSADSNGWSACMHDRSEFRTSRQYQINDIVDRVGSGDAFAAGLIYGLLVYVDDQRALEFATAAGCLKHSIPGDVQRADVAEVEALVAGSGSGRVQR
jgi:2-dehydro-3-deoxygluconokinase